MKEKFTTKELPKDSPQNSPRFSWKKQSARPFTFANKFPRNYIPFPNKININIYWNSSKNHSNAQITEKCWVKIADATKRLATNARNKRRMAKGSKKKSPTPVGYVHIAVYLFSSNGILPQITWTKMVCGKNCASERRANEWMKKSAFVGGKKLNWKYDKLIKSVPAKVLRPSHRVGTWI